MDTNGAPQVVSLVDAQQEPAFLLLGNGAAAVPGVLRARADRPYSAIVLTSRIEPAELATALEQARDPAVPIADFGDNRGLRPTSSEIAWIQPAWRRPGDTSLRSSAAWPSFRSEPRRQNVPN